ncbi:hypothetical protein KC331_g1284 [Hortaea werneckii]|nr:hypothetical protein KC331_g1284 [Hortaea werneckii]
MLWDERLLNGTKEQRDAWAEEQWPHIQIIWAFMILLHFAALIHVDPIVIHWLSTLLRRVGDTGEPMVWSRQQQQQLHSTYSDKSQNSHAAMSGYLANLLTNTTSRYNNLRRTLLSNEEDGDTEDDSHISRVLRAYYNEKGRPLPPWLPADPNDRRATTPQPGMQPSGYFASSARSSAAQQGAPGANSRPTSLSDLWDPAPAPQQSSMQPQSLRAGRVRPGAGQPQPSSGNTLAPPQARPLPSQRAGSYQSMQSQGGRPGIEPSPPSSSGGGGTAQDRLKARLWGAARAHSSNSVNSVNSQQSGYGR